MNDKNTELFFGDEEEVVLTLTDENGQDIDAEIVAAFEIEELSTEYVVVLPITDEEEDEDEDQEVIILKYREDEDGNPDMSPIEDEEESELAAEGLRQLLKSGAIEGFECSDEDEEDGEDAYLDEIGDIFPGVSIDKE